MAHSVVAVGCFGLLDLALLAVWQAPLVLNEVRVDLLARSRSEGESAIGRLLPAREPGALQENDWPNRRRRCTREPVVLATTGMESVQNSIQVPAAARGQRGRS